MRDYIRSLPMSGLYKFLASTRSAVCLGSYRCFDIYHYLNTPTRNHNTRIELLRGCRDRCLGRIEHLGQSTWGQLPKKESEKEGKRLRKRCQSCIDPVKPSSNAFGNRYSKTTMKFVVFVQSKFTYW